MKDRQHLVEHSETHLPCSTKHKTMKALNVTDFEVKVDVSVMQCKICSERFNNIYNLGFHLAHKHKLPYDLGTVVGVVAFRLIDLKCLVCFKQMNSIRGLIQHTNKEHPVNFFECDQCGKKFRRKHDLSGHINQTHKEEYRCPKCPKTFKSKAEYLKHKNEDHISQCNLCFQTFSSSGLRLKHMKDEHDIALGGTCGFCHKKLNSRFGFLDHAGKCSVGGPVNIEVSLTPVKIDTDATDPMSLPTLFKTDIDMKDPMSFTTSIKPDTDMNQSFGASVKTDRDIKSPVEGETVTAMVAMREAKRMARSSIAYVFNNTTVIPFKRYHNKFRCFYCQDEFNSCNDLRNHSVEQHPVCDVKLKCMKLSGLGYQYMGVKVDSSILACKLCHDQYEDLKILLLHLETEHGAKLGNCADKLLPFKLVDDQYPCPQCGEEFSSFGNTLIHFNKEHNTENRVLCVTCGESFHGVTSLQIHKNRCNVAPERFKCTRCDLGFYNKSQLTRHMGMAHKKKVFKCPNCTELFSSEHAKMMHIIKDHKGGYQCTHCDASFIFRSRLIQHIRRLHLLEKNEKCPYCDKMFFDQRRLKNHLVLHTGERAFSCDYCDKTFSWKKNLISHINVHLKNAGHQKRKERKQYLTAERKVPSKKQRQQNLEILFNNTTIIPIKILGKYRCFFCELKLEDRQQLVKHNETHLPCSTDDKSLKGLRGEDYKINVDVSEIKCRVCSEQFSNIYEVGFHLARKHDFPYDENVNITFGAYRLVDLKCTVCDKEFNKLRTLIIHMKDEHDHYECNDCGKKFSQRRVLITHSKEHKDEYKCLKCQKEFGSRDEYVRHMNQDHVSHCILCLKTFASSELRFFHMKAEHNVSRGGTCGFCHKKMNSRTGILAHAGVCSVEKKVEKKVENVLIEVDIENPAVIRQKMNYVLNNTTLVPFKYYYSRIQCFYCSKRFLSGNDFRNHSTTEHAGCDPFLKGINLKHIKVDSSILECKLCHTETDDIKSLLAHLETEHKANLSNCADKFHPFKLIDDRYPCPECGEEFPRLYVMFKHYHSAHDALKRDLCLYCGKSFHSETTLRYHIDRRHKKQESFKCSECGLAFVYQSELKAHTGVAHKKKVVKCSQCPEQFVSHHAKNMHNIKVHGGGYKCTHCDASFVDYTYMTKHVRSVHLKEKNIKCTYCGKAFFDHLALKRHMVVHTGTKTFSCNYCDKKFISKPCLISHLNVHVVERKFSCKFCDKKYKSRSNLKQHMNIHMPERSFGCDYCDKKFTWNQNLRSHMRVHLGDASRSKE